MLVTWSSGGYDSEVDLYIVRAVLRYGIHGVIYIPLLSLTSIFSFHFKFVVPSKLERC
jgi:hypothetical protein